MSPWRFDSRGGGSMPAYGKNLNPADTAALVALSGNARPDGQAAAGQASAQK